jgi:hypothetical protein
VDAGTKTLEAFDVEKVWQDAVELLGRVGLKVQNAEILRRLSGRLPVVGGWVRFGRDVLERYADELRSRAAAPAQPDDDRITIFNSSLNYSYLDPATGRCRSYDRQAVVRHTRLALQLRREGLLAGGVTGYPRDVPPRMQLLMPTYYDCVYNPSPAIHSVIHDAAQFRYLLEIGELFGIPVGLGTELVSPMKFVGDSIDLAFEYVERDMPVSVDPMPILGITAPMDWHLGYAQSVAENMGSYAIFRSAGFTRVSFPSFRLFVPNMRAGMIYFSSPLHLAALLARRKVREFFGARTHFAELLLVAAKRPDAQAAAEKMAGCLLGRMHGFSLLEGAGGLWLDAIFSPVQLLIDVEICNYVNSIRADFAPRGGDAVEAVRRGVEAGSFFDDPLTLNRFEDFIWRPRLFDLAPPSGRGDGDLAERARRIADAKADEYDYELAGPKRQELERIMARAAKELS